MGNWNRDSRMFSSRLPAHLEPNALTRALEHARAAGAPLIDLTLSNPTQAGFEYPPDILRALSNPEAAVYRPQPLGSRHAREAIAQDYARRGVDTSWERIVLTASTSEAYSLLFKLLCAPSGDSVLIPSPSYPLFDHLASLDGVNAVPYRLDYDGRWWVNFDSVDASWDARVRAVLAVSPNNPTGSVLTTDEHDAFLERSAGRGAAVIVDEVFADYPTEDDGWPPDEVRNDRALRFRLGGLSKSAALPQVKLGWMAIDGPQDLVGIALERLELICDTYLSVSTPVQVAAAELIARGAGMRRQVLERIRANFATLRSLAERHPAVAPLPLEAGWSTVLRIPARGSEEQIALDVLSSGVIVHPGFFFDFPHEAFLVVSLLPRPDEFREGMRRLLERVDA